MQVFKIYLKALHKHFKNFKIKKNNSFYSSISFIIKTSKLLGWVKFFMRGFVLILSLISLTTSQNLVNKLSLSKINFNYFLVN